MAGPDDQAVTAKPELPVAAAPGTILAAILELARDPALDVPKFEALLTMQERAERRQAEIEFNQAFSRLSGKLPRVKKNGRVELGQGRGSYPFARWEDCDRIIRPLMEEEGFALSFDSQPREGGGLIITGTLLHRNGHTRSASMPLPLDAGPGRNALQASGSTLSYGRRYVAELLLNIVRESDDDDGVAAAGEPITPAQLAELSAAMTEAGFREQAMLDLLGVTALAEIRRNQLAIARNAIAMRQRQRKQ